MAQALHRAIRDALRDADGYERRGILVTSLLDATRTLGAEESLLYRSVYTVFRALPERLMEGSILNIATADVEDGVELMWEGREPVGGPDGGDLRSVLAQGPHGDLVEIALLALESFCKMRAGHFDTHREAVSSSSSFQRPPHVIRRVLAYIPSADAGVPPLDGRHPKPTPADERFLGARARFTNPNQPPGDDSGGFQARALA